MVDFTEVKAQYPIDKVVQLLGLEVTKQRNGQLRGCCPIHGGSDARGFVITPSRGLWYCFKGCGGGDQLALISKLRKCSVQQACEWLAGGTSTAIEEHSSGTSSRTPPESDSFEELGYLEPEHDAVVAAGLDIKIAKLIGAGYAPRGTMRGQVLVPIRLRDGSLIGYIGTNEITQPPRWRLPQQKIVQLDPKRVRRS